MQQSVQGGIHADTLILNMSTAIGLLLRDGSLVFANHAFYRLFTGVSERNRIALLPFFMQNGLYEEDASRFERFIFDAFSTGAVSGPLILRFEHPERNNRAIKVSGHLMLHEGESALLMEFHDISEQIVVDADVLKLQDRLQFAVKSLRNGVFEFDYLTGNWTFNDSFGELTGIEVKDNSAVIARFLSAISKTDKIKLLRFLLHSVSNSARQHVQVSFKSDSVGQRIFWIIPACILDENGGLNRFIGVVHDITEQWHKEEQLKLERASMLSMMDAQRTMIVRIDRHGNILQSNRAFRNLHTFGDFCLEKSNILEIFPAERSEEFRRLFQESLEHERRIDSIEIEWQIPGQKVLHTEWDFVPIKSRFGTYDELQLLGVDISIVDHLSKEVEATNSNLRSLINNFQNVSIWSVDQNLKLIAFNEHFKHEYELFWGKTPTVGDEIYKVTRPDQQAIQYWRDQFQRTLGGEYFFIEYELDGSFFEVFFNPIEVNGVITGVACYGQDVSRQKLTERRLRLSEERWQFAVEGNHYGLWEWDAERDKMYFSPSCFAMLGYAEGEMLRESAFAFSDLVHPSDLSHVLAPFKQILSGEIAEFNVEMRLLDKSGQYRWILNRGRVFKTKPDGTPQRILGIWSDISQQKSSEQLIRRHMENLEKFASITSHELRHPAASIMGIVRQLNEAHNTEEDTKILLNKLTEASDKLDDIISEMNSLLRPNSDSPNTQSMSNEGQKAADNQIQSVWLIDDDLINNVLNERVFRKFRPYVQIRSFTQAQDALMELKDDPTGRPDLILLDINMPGMNGWDFLDELCKENIQLMVFMLSSSIDPKDFERAKRYEMVKDYIAKPLKEDHLVKFSK